MCCDLIEEQSIAARVLPTCHIYIDNYMCLGEKAIYPAVNRRDTVSMFAFMIKRLSINSGQRLLYYYHGSKVFLMLCSHQIYKAVKERSRNCYMGTCSLDTSYYTCRTHSISSNCLHR